MPLSEFQYWLTARGLAPLTISDTLKRIDYLKRNSALTKEGFTRFIVSNRARLTNNTINVYLKALKNYGKYTRDEAILTLKLLPQNSSPRQSLSVDELSRFLSITVPHRRKEMVDYGLFFKLIAFCGMRPAELAKLTTDDVSFAEGCLYLVDTKTHDTRKVPIPEAIRGELEAYCHTHHRLFKTCAQQWGEAFHYRLKKAGINRPHITPYSLRHTAITLLLQQPNSNLFDIQSLVGHKDANTTAIYYHSCLERIKKVVQGHPLLSQSMSVEERARLVSDTIRALGISYEPLTQTTSEGCIVSVSIRGSPATVGGSVAAKHGNPPH
jgi:integrase